MPMNTDYHYRTNQIKFTEQQRAKSHLQVAKTMIETINRQFAWQTGDRACNNNAISSH